MDRTPQEREPHKMHYVNATEAARLTGRSERTIRRAIKAGKLKARPGPGHSYAIRISDLEDWTRAQAPDRRASGQLAGHQAQADMLSDLVDRVGLDQLAVRQAQTDMLAMLSEQNDRIASLETRIEALEALIESGRTLDRSMQDKPPAEHSSAIAAIPDTVPAGSILLAHFCRMHGLKARTLNDQVRDGKIDVTVVDRKGRNEYWLSPAQQERLKTERRL